MSGAGGKNDLRSASAVQQASAAQTLETPMSMPQKMVTVVRDAGLSTVPCTVAITHRADRLRRDFGFPLEVELIGRRYRAYVMRELAPDPSGAECSVAVPHDLSGRLDPVSPAPGRHGINSMTWVISTLDFVVDSIRMFERNGRRNCQRRRVTK
jgi:hypothetical protein